MDATNNAAGCFKVKVIKSTDTAKFTNVITARFGESWYLFRESEETIEEETKISRWVSDIKWDVMNFSKFLFNTYEKQLP